MIAISAGHWKVGTGAVGFVDEVQEARRVVQKLTQLLKQQGVIVHSIVDNQSTNQRQNLNYLVRAHNKVKRKVDVSIHFNATNKTELLPIGTEVLVHSAKMLELANNLSVAISNASGLKNRGAKQRNDLYFLNNSEVGAILIEVCFVNSKEDVLLYQNNFDVICQAIADTLLQYVGMTNSEMNFSSQSLQQLAQQIVTDQKFVQQIINQAISRKLIQKSWQQKLIKREITFLDVCGMALLLSKNEFYET